MRVIVSGSDAESYEDYLKKNCRRMHHVIEGPDLETTVYACGDGTYRVTYAAGSGEYRRLAIHVFHDYEAAKKKFFELMRFGDKEVEEPSVKHMLEQIKESLETRNT